MVLELIGSAVLASVIVGLRIIQEGGLKRLTRLYVDNNKSFNMAITIYIVGFIIITLLCAIIFHIQLEEIRGL